MDPYESEGAGENTKAYVLLDFDFVSVMATVHRHSSREYSTLH